MNLLDKAKIIEEFIQSLDIMSGTGNGIGKATVGKIKKFAEQYGNCGLAPDQASEMRTENVDFKKAFGLSCRVLGDYLECPYAECGVEESWRRWQKYIIEKTENEDVCRVCGCTQHNACKGGCYWVEPDLCSKCVGE